MRKVFTAGILMAMIIMMISGCADQSSAGIEPGSESSTTELPVTESSTAEITTAGANTVAANAAEQERLQAQEDILLTEAPVLAFQDALSSRLEALEVSAGSYSWSYKMDGEMTTVVACGAHPLEMADVKKNFETWKLPVYNGLDYVMYSVFCLRIPDRIIVDEYRAEDRGDTEAEPVSTKTYEDALCIELRPGRIYGITAQWDEENLESNGFYGSAEYVIETE